MGFSRTDLSFFSKPAATSTTLANNHSCCFFLYIFHNFNVSLLWDPSVRLGPVCVCVCVLGGRLMRKVCGLQALHPRRDARFASTHTHTHTHTHITRTFTHAHTRTSSVCHGRAWMSPGLRNAPGVFSVFFTLRAVWEPLSKPLSEPLPPASKRAAVERTLPVAHFTIKTRAAWRKPGKLRLSWQASVTNENVEKYFVRGFYTADYTQLSTKTNK